MITLNDIQRGYEAWAAKSHNAKWVRKIDGTPIPNDIPVSIFMYLKESGLLDPPAPAEGIELFGHWSKHRLSDGCFLPLPCYVPEGPDYTTIPLYRSVHSQQVQGVAVAEIVSKHGDPEAFGERELVALVDIQKYPYRTKLYAAAPAKQEAGE